ncbi:SUKH-3 domain-containing protein [Kitasatospora sp. NPDC101157]|uniref:effector-associated constant component EACC1 n=1 Tax=Kitasatospora sp. NPDC101157 TaxID=3364098 RepID=UPI0037F5BB14
MRFDPRAELVLLSAGWVPDRWSGLALAKAAAEFESSGNALPGYALKFFAEFAGLSLRFPNPRDPKSLTGVDFGCGTSALHPFSLSSFCREAGEDLCVVGLGVSGSIGFYLLGASGAFYCAWDDIHFLGRDFAEGVLRTVTARRPGRPLPGSAARPRLTAAPPRPSRLHRLPTRRRWSARPRLPSDATTLGEPVHVRISVTGGEASAEAESLADKLRAHPEMLDVRLTSRATCPEEQIPVQHTVSVVVGEVGGLSDLARALSFWLRGPRPHAVRLTVHRAGTRPVEINPRKAWEEDIELLLCGRTRSAKSD